MNEVNYIYSTTSLLERYQRIDRIIAALEIAMETQFAGETSGLDYYILDDGQTKITTSYRDVRLIPQAIEHWEKKQVKILNKLNGHGMILRDVRGLL